MENNGLGYILGDFSQTHLVNLPAGPGRVSDSKVSSWRQLNIEWQNIFSDIRWLSATNFEHKKLLKSCSNV
jgi:hypothetical protein